MEQASILVIGGAEDKVNQLEILQTFWQRAGGVDAQLGIIPAASGEPAMIGEIYQRLFENMGCKAVQVLDVREREQSEDPSWHNHLGEMTGIFLTGGDQLRLATLLADSALLTALRFYRERGTLTLAGTSAGAAAMGYHMIAGGGSGESPHPALVSMAGGLGFLPGVIVDQHFHNRNRVARLLSAVVMHPECLGVGVDEDTCAVFEADGQLQVVGRGTVMIVDAGEASYFCEPQPHSTLPISAHNLRVHLLRWGDRFDVQHRRVLPPLLHHCSA
ncbi:cyanophycinase [Gloeomargarita lithophora Alchichica-D10]|uniref:Cyanophycinase n=2 Tax=Gloeomargarita TaxID=1188227 RepID=A0A1J0AAP7_9CYAN|nr:cyanophycinase [Gloeomargarita lithophora Alchichica-D10]